MFNKIIELKSGEKISYGGTPCSYQQTLAQVMDLLKKHGCEKIGTIQEGNDLKIIFQIDKIPFVIDVPKVYVKNIYKEKIGIRIVYWYLKSVLEMVKKRIVPIHTLLLPCVQVRDSDDGKVKPMGDVWIKQLAEGKINPEELLLGE